MKTDSTVPVSLGNGAGGDGAPGAGPGFGQAVILDAGAAATVAVPPGFDLMRAEFLRQGPDLLLEAPGA
ncbi:MAG: hypothetical protein QF827_04570, partial [Alphaproteobacteria bacterium]|nr:hypothetical protein [Alphaproteobacteria bacterium]